MIQAIIFCSVIHKKLLIQSTVKRHVCWPQVLTWTVIAHNGGSKWQNGYSYFHHVLKLSLSFLEGYIRSYYSHSRFVWNVHRIKVIHTCHLSNINRQRQIVVEKVNAEEWRQTVKTKSTILYCQKTQHFVCGQRHLTDLEQLPHVQSGMAWL